MISRTLIVLAFLGTSGCTRPVQTVLASADGHYKRGSYETAAREYGEVTERQPGRWWAHYRLGECLLELDRPADARRELEVALAHQPGEPRVIEALAESMYREGDEAGLFAFLAREAEAARSVDAYLRLGRFCALINDPDSAQTAFHHAIELDDGRTVEPYLQAAAFEQRIGDIEEALRLLNRAYLVDPKDGRVSQRIRDLGEVPGPTYAAPAEE